MAGVGSAYQQLDEPKESMSQSLQFWGSQYMNIGKEKRQRDEERRIARDKENKELLSKYDLTEDDFYTKDTGVKTLDAVAMEANINAFKSYAQDKRSLQELLAKGKSMFDPEVTRLQMRMSQYKTNAKKMNEVADMYRGAYEAYKNDPNASGANGNFEKQLSAVFDGRMKFRTDENGQLVSLLEVKDEDGSSRVVEQPYTMLQHGRMSHIKGNDLNTLGKNLADTIDKEDRTDLNGIYSIHEIKWDDRKSNSVKELLKPNLSSNDFMADALYKITNGAVTKTSGFTDEEREQVSDFIIDLAKAQFQSKYEKKTDSGMVSRANNRDTNATSRANNRDNNATRMAIAKMQEARKQAEARAREEKNKEKLAKAQSLVNIGKAISTDGGKSYYQTVTLKDIKGNVTPFVIGQASITNKDASGKEYQGIRPVLATNIMISTDKNGNPTNKFIKYVDPETGRQTVLKRSADPARFDMMQAQIQGHVDYNFLQMTSADRASELISEMAGSAYIQDSFSNTGE